MPSPPTSTRGAAAPRRWPQPASASDSSDPCARLDMSDRPSTQITYSPSRQLRRIAPPSGVVAFASVSQGFISSGRLEGYKSTTEARSSPGLQDVCAPPEAGQGDAFSSEAPQVSAV